MKLQLQAYGICVIYYVLVSLGFAHAKLYINDTIDIFETRDATANVDNIEGYIEYANPPDACSGISQPNFPQNFTMKKIVLINGTTTCDFFTKVQNAKQVGYDVAVLFDPSPGPFEYPNITFPVPISEVNVSVFLVSFEDGIVIRDLYLYHMRDKDHFKIDIFPTPPAWKVYLAYFILGFVPAMFVICLAVLCFELLKCIWNSFCNCFRNRVERRVALRNLRRRFPSQVFSNDHPFEVCVICRCNFELGEHIRVLGCPHAYHTVCIDKWLVDNQDVCPLCKGKVNLENSCEHSVSDPTETTRLLTSAHSMYSSVRTGNASSPSNALEVVYNIPITLSNESDELWVDDRCSINSLHQNEPDDDDQQRLMV